MTTDLATVHRLSTWQPDEIIYVTDGRQQLHFQQLFNIHGRGSRRRCKLVHVWFGSILGPDGKPLNAAAAAVSWLIYSEAEERALAVVAEKNPYLDAAEQKAIARVVGLGALKYADLNNRQSDYVFDWDKMPRCRATQRPICNTPTRACTAFSARRGRRSQWGCH